MATFEGGGHPEASVVLLTSTFRNRGRRAGRMMFMDRQKPSISVETTVFP